MGYHGPIYAGPRFYSGVSNYGCNITKEPAYQKCRDGLWLGEIGFYPTRLIQAALKQVSSSAINDCTIPLAKKPNLRLQILPPG